MGSHKKFLQIEFYMNKKERVDKEIIGDRARRVCEFLIMLDHIGELWISRMKS
jgi:hypothetical protein